MAASMRSASHVIKGIAWFVALCPCSLASGQSTSKLLAPPPKLATRPAAPSATPADRPPSLLPAPTSQSSPAPAAAGASRDLTPGLTADSRAGLKITKGAGILPNDHGQVWREYDISPYTLHVRDVAKPEQAIIDWILRETGTEVWFAEPLGILNASSTTLRVYHTPQMQEQVRGIVERFVGGEAEAHTLAVRLMTVGSPNWRAAALPLLRPVDVKSPGVEAWLLSRENAVQLYEQLKARGDFREHSSPRVEIANGQSQTLARTQPRSYSKSLQLKREFPFYDLIAGKIDEGYSLEITPLLSLDRQTIEAAVTCRVDQVEKLVPLAIDVPVGTQSQRVQIQVPQMASWRLSERFRWPTSDVLLLSCGVVANPAPGAAGALSLLAPLGMASNRADALLMIDPKPPSVTTLAAAPSKTVPIALPAPPPTATTATASSTSAPPAKAPLVPANPVSRGRY
jgi:hypothetical protein